MSIRNLDLSRLSRSDLLGAEIEEVELAAGASDHLAEEVARSFVPPDGLQWQRRSRTRKAVLKLLDLRLGHLAVLGAILARNAYTSEGETHVLRIAARISEVRTLRDLLRDGVAPEEPAPHDLDEVEAEPA